MLVSLRRQRHRLFVTLGLLLLLTVFLGWLGLIGHRTSTWRQSYGLSLVRRWSPRGRGRGIADLTDYINRRQRHTLEGDTYQLVQRNCSIPYVPPFTRMFNLSSGRVDKPRPRSLLDYCTQAPDFSRLNSKNELFLTDPEIKVKDCCVRPIKRPYTYPPDSFKYAEQNCRMFDARTRSLDVTDVEMIQVSCGKLKNNFHLNVPSHLNGVKRVKEEFWAGLKRKGAEQPPSVFLMILGSTSRTHAQRSLPKTLELLTRGMGFVDFKGHHPMGETPLVNAIGLLMGLHHKDFWGTFKQSPKDFWDSAPFIWSTFNRLNYITGLFQDLARHSPFNMHQRGFLRQPADFYTRPLLVAHDKAHPFNGKRICFGNRTAMEFLLDHQRALLQRLQSTPTFFVSWSQWPQNEDPASLANHDSALHAFFSQLKGGVMENTLFILTSDHAFTKNTYARSPEGLVERRTIPLLVRLPDRLVREGKEEGLSMLNSLLRNSEGVTSGLDVHAMMLEVGRMAENGRGIMEEEEDYPGRGSSGGRNLLHLLSEGEERSCMEAGIVQTMCACDLPLPQDAPHLSGKENKRFAINESQFAMKID